MKRKISAILLISMLAGLAACGDNTENPVETTPGSESESTTVAGHDFGNHDFGDSEFNILNGSNTWSMYSAMDFEEQTGEPLDDAIFNRNRKLEDLYNFKLVVTEKQQDKDLLPEIKKFISAGEDIYDVVYLGSNLAGAVVSEGYYLDLNKVSGFNFDKEYWDQSVITEGTIGKNNALYFASSPAQLMTCEGAWIMYFNERMLDGLGLDAPYQLVRDGKWTFDELGKYMKAGADLNGDESFNFSVDGKAIYGLASSYAFPSGCITAAGISYISKDKDGNPYFSLESDRFYTLADKLASMFAKEGEYVSRNGAGKDHYEEIFKAGRALFLGAELKAAGKLRDFNDSFGIVPIPKLEADQDSYHVLMSLATLMMSIPVTNNEPEKAAVIMDALSYLSYEDVLPQYYDVRVAQKSLRNDESVEMLSLIRASLRFDIGDPYGWTADLKNQIRRKIDAGDSGIASIIAAAKPGIEASIKTSLEKFSD